MRRLILTMVLVIPLFGVAAVSSAADELQTMRGEIVDAASGMPLPARLYIRSQDGRWFFARSADERGSAVEYSKERSPTSVERHTTLSAHPFVAELPPGRYTLTVERGKEYLSENVTVDVKDEPLAIKIKLRRWIDMSRLGWYSGETHVHRSLDELPTAMLADDLNVALPLTYWVTRSHTPPSRGDKNAPAARAELIRVDATHVIYPMNTEYEIFTVGERRHTLGAIFALNHKSVLDRGVPPVRPIAERVHGEGGLLELDKHNWPWSMMLVPVMNVDLYELTNNHVWRTEFFFRQFGEAPPAYMNVERDGSGMTEKGWLDFTFQNYYALLNCGFRLRPTAGTASGVHPVPLGFGRVYVHIEGEFSYDAWMKGLDQGNSFVTTGPMLVARINDRLPGSTFKLQRGDVNEFLIHGSAKSARPLLKIELVAAGQVARTINPANRPLPDGGYESPIELKLTADESTWFTLRCYEPTADGRERFAHTAPWHIDVANAPLRPRREEVQFLIDRVDREIERNTGVLPDAFVTPYSAPDPRVMSHPMCSDSERTISSIRSDESSM
jgi:hypothetical protein